MIRCKSDTKCQKFKSENIILCCKDCLLSGDCDYQCFKSFVDEKCENEIEEYLNVN